MQATSDPMLGWIRTESIDGSSATSTCVSVRQLWDSKASALIDVMAPKTMGIYANLCGHTLAGAHAPSGDAVAIASYLGSGGRPRPRLRVFRRGLRRPERARLGRAQGCGRGRADPYRRGSEPG